MSAPAIARRCSIMNDEQATVANAYIGQLDKAGVYPAKIVTTVTPYTDFYQAEDYHQDAANTNNVNPRYLDLLRPAEDRQPEGDVPGGVEGQADARLRQERARLRPKQVRSPIRAYDRGRSKPDVRDARFRAPSFECRRDGDSGHRLRRVGGAVADDSQAHGQRQRSSCARRGTRRRTSCVGLPVLLAGAGVAGWLRPGRVWRWALLVVAGQAVAMALIHPPGTGLGLLPLAVVFIGVPLALVLTIAAIAGAVISRRGWAGAILA